MSEHDEELPAVECEEGLSTPQEQAILALLREPSIAAAAKSSGVGERTLHRWMRREDFMTAYRNARREAFAQAIGLTQRSAATAVGTLLRIMHDPKATWAARVAASNSILKFARESIELDDLAERIVRLEQSMQEEGEP
jgi:hypothetical protein